MADESKTRTVTPNGSAIRDLRMKKAWRVEDLAEHSGRSVRTIERLEQGAAAYLCTIGAVAEALEVEVTRLLNMDADGPPPMPVQGRQASSYQVSLTINISLTDFDETSQLIDLLDAFKRFIGAKDPIEVRDVKSGSTVITLGVSYEDMLHLTTLVLRAFFGKIDPDSIVLTGPISFTFLDQKVEVRLVDWNRFRADAREIAELRGAHLKDKPAATWLRFTLLSRPTEGEARFRIRLSDFWTKLLREQPRLYEQVYAEAVQFRLDADQIARTYLIDSAVVGILSIYLRAAGFDYEPVRMDDVCVADEVVAPDWVLVQR